MLLVQLAQGPSLVTQMRVYTEDILGGRETIHGGHES